MVMMTNQTYTDRIRHLLTLYDEAQTTDAEEQELAEYFASSQEVPEDMMYYKALFKTMSPTHVRLQTLSPALPLYGEGDHPEGIPPLWRKFGWVWGVISVAASVIIIIGAVLLYNKKDTPEPATIANSAQTTTWQRMPELEPTAPAEEEVQYVGGPANFVPIKEEAKEEWMTEVASANNTTGPTRIMGSGLIMTHADSMLTGRVAGASPDDWEPSGQHMMNKGIRLGRNPKSDAWRDSIVIRVDGEESPYLLSHVDINGVFDIDLPDYFYRQNRLINELSPYWCSIKVLKKHLNEEEIKEWEEEYGRKFDGTRYVADIETEEFTPVRLLTKKQLSQRKQEYLIATYRKGREQDRAKINLSTAPLDTEIKEHFFALRSRIADTQDEYIGRVHEDEQGIYVPIVRTNRLYGSADHTLPYFRTDSMTAEIRHAAEEADHAVEFADSEMRYIAFAFGGNVERVEPHYNKDFESRISPFLFTADPHQSSTLWGEAQIRLEDHTYQGMLVNKAGEVELILHLTDKLYAKDLPEINGNLQWVEGTVVDTDGHPLEGFSVAPKYTSDGVMTDADGHFKMCLPFKDMYITATCNGYKTRTVKASDTHITIIVERWGENKIDYSHDSALPVLQ